MNLHLQNFIFFTIFLNLIITTISSSSSSSSSDDPQTFIIHVSKSQKPSIFSTHHDWYSSTIRSLSSSSSSSLHPTKLLYTYNHVVHGFSAHLTSSQVLQLSKLPYVHSILPDVIQQLHTTRTPRFLGLADSFGLWPNSDYADDVIVGVLDTGIWPERSSFNDSGLSEVPEKWKGVCETGPEFPACNRKIIGAKAFYKGYESSSRYIDWTKESKSPRDTEGHGTHTSSTAAGSYVNEAGFYQYALGEARGMATKGRIAMYKICWSAGCYNSDILAAMDQAVADGVDVISLSVGASGYAPEYVHDSIAIGAFGAIEKGVVVSCSAGNSGPDAFTATNIAPWILTVGASTLDREFPADVILGDGRIFSGVSLYSGEPLKDSDVPLVYADDCGSRYCYSGRLDSSKVAGKIVICDRGGNARVAKGDAVKRAGGVGMILANTDDAGEELIADSHLIPATTVGAIVGDKIREYARSQPSPTATIEFRGTVIGPSPPAPKVASFSSRGPNQLTPEILKPDVIAPGVNILAAWTGATSPTDLDIDPRRTEFNIISGTSMSCPHVSGLAALLKKAYPTWSPGAIKSALMTTAYNLDNSGKTLSDLAGGESTPFVHGAGHVDPNRALNPGLVYDLNVDDYIAFFCSIGYNSKSISVFIKDQSSIDCNSTTLASPGSEVDAVYEAKVISPPSVETTVSPSKLVFSKDNTSLSYVIKFKSKNGGQLGSVPAKFGSIEWSDGFHLVRSPIAFRWRQEYVSSL
ncbi:hypothetical protein AQUCO_01200261v1 [Aquilegia coerulea]|uniref:Subtilisin-like protease n=1 Tax=Aquilegia coerulea TaxID=218851 RepID=A0A2G5E533_AQUCA|nr:hypothetical protein AQUCO_01200261v1 [Aquilegia coerulea]